MPARREFAIDKLSPSEISLEDRQFCWGQYLIKGQNHRPYLTFAAFATFTALTGGFRAGFRAGAGSAFAAFTGGFGAGFGARTGSAFAAFAAFGQ
jgi:hypothetical protein